MELATVLTKLEQTDVSHHASEPDGQHRHQRPTSRLKATMRCMTATLGSSVASLSAFIRCLSGHQCTLVL